MINKKVDKVAIMSICFCIGVFLKQFYVFRSGTVQICDAFFVLSAIIYLSLGRMIFYKHDVILGAFLVCICLVNGLYFIVYQYSGFLVATIYYMYNFVIVVVFRVLLSRKDCIERLVITYKLNLCSQFLIFFIGRGRYFFYRYQGTFNDPNQYGYFILMDIFLLYLSCGAIQKKLEFRWFILSGFLIMLSTSSGMLLGYSIFLIVTILLPAIYEKRVSLKFFHVIIALIVLTVLLFGRDQLVQLASKSNWTVMQNIVMRLTKKSDELSSNSGIMGFLHDRLMRRIVVAPKYFIYGCGEGYFRRFLNISGERGEIHSTMVAICYYYGIIPFMIFLYWIYKNIRFIHLKYIAVYLAALAEAFTLINHRQPFFWMLFAMGSCVSVDYYKVFKSQREDMRNEDYYERSTDDWNGDASRSR